MTAHDGLGSVRADRRKDLEGTIRPPVVDVAEGSLPAFTPAELERFWSKVKKTDTCWLWIGGLTYQGYGQFTIWDYDNERRRTFRSHRVTFILENGEPESGLVLDHICRNRACVRPDHLRAVTDRVNTLAGIGPAAINARKTRCKNGHELTPENTYVNPTTGYRNCRICRADLNRAWRAKRYAARAPKVEATECRNGHPITSENTRYRANGTRICADCANERSRRYRRALLNGADDANE